MTNQESMASYRILVVMKNNLKAFLRSVLVVCLLSSCGKKAIDKVKISVHCEGTKNSKIQAFTMDMISMDRILLSGDRLVFR